MLSLVSENLVSQLQDSEVSVGTSVHSEGEEAGDSRILHGLSLVLGTDFDEARYHQLAIKPDEEYFHDQLFPTNPATIREDPISLDVEFSSRQLKKTISSHPKIAIKEPNGQ